MVKRKIEYSAKSTDGQDVTGFVRSDSERVEELRKAIRMSLSQAGIDVHDIVIHGLIPKGESRMIQDAYKLATGFQE